ncbi:hypothetical protein FGO68_gene14658 [Halteria grandinella]|uniref:Uncharacterized protein n=1 Tax=Halteria grandinella TaxID=5974 RepID=A0A8J8NA59_HALGN|nr:hypothetical protein FGO68_gene14658 [Halteria grandinella]
MTPSVTSHSSLTPLHVLPWRFKLSRISAILQSPSALSAKEPSISVQFSSIILIGAGSKNGASSRLRVRHSPVAISRFSVLLVNVVVRMQVD